MFDLKLNEYEYFHLFEVVGRGSETQLHVGENVNYLISATRNKHPNARKFDEGALLWPTKELDSFKFSNDDNEMVDTLNAAVFISFKDGITNTNLSLKL